MPRRVIAVVDDMFFVSKIRATAEGVGVQIEFVRSAAAILDSDNRVAVALIIVDLNVGSCDPFELADRLRSDETLEQIPLLGFFSHVQTELLQRAEQAGYDRVVPRSLFSRELAKILDGSF